MKLLDPFSLPQRLPLPWGRFNLFAKQYFQARVKQIQRNRPGGPRPIRVYVDSDLIAHTLNPHAWRDHGA